MFADEGDILKEQPDPDIAYNQLIRPGKSRLGLFYVDRRTLGIDIQLCWFLTGVAIVSRRRALTAVERLLQSLGAPADLVALARREVPLVPMPPPGATAVVTSRQ